MLTASARAGLLDEHLALQPELQQGTGVVFASAFPALGSQVKESERFHSEGEGYCYNRKATTNPRSSRAPPLPPRRQQAQDARLSSEACALLCVCVAHSARVRVRV